MNYLPMWCLHDFNYLLCNKSKSFALPHVFLWGRMPKGRWNTFHSSMPRKNSKLGEITFVTWGTRKNVGFSILSNVYYMVGA